MSKYYIGVDIGSISTKGVLIDKDNNIIVSKYIWTEGDPINATKNIIAYMKEKIKDLNLNVEIYGIGTTGSARNLIGSILNANVVMLK